MDRIRIRFDSRSCDYSGYLCLANKKFDFGTICGILCGSMANPMALGYANDTVNGETSNISYATVYPLGMFIRVINSPDTGDVLCLKPPIVAMQITLSHLSVGYKVGHAVVSDINLTLQSGKLASLIGANGVGEVYTFEDTDGLSSQVGGKSSP